MHAPGVFVGQDGMMSVCGLIDEARHNNETRVFIVEFCCGTTVSLPHCDIISDVAVLGKAVEMAEKVRKAYELRREDVASLPDAHRLKCPDR